jgi:ABC-type bacteriocin/lantibiotic exporter with double-glycine peptidase domain
MGHVTDLPLENLDGMEIEDSEPKGMEINIKNLYFSYPDNKKPVLKDVNLDINAGERVCISGYNGSGKSTLLQVIAGLYEQFDGILSYNGIPIGNLNIENLRTYIGDSLHEEKLFKGTLYENISLGRPGVNTKIVMKSSEKVLLMDFVRNLKDGFNTIIDPEGKNLPDSIKTKIILARSIACKSRLLLITDHLTRLDPKECGQIMEFLVRPENPWTLIVISNQSEIAVKCDRVVLMKDGSIIGNEHYDTLSQKDMFYKANVV